MSRDLKITWFLLLISASANASLPSAPHLALLPRDLAWNRGRIALEVRAREAFMDMAAAAERDGVELRVVSGFRSRETQAGIVGVRLGKGQSAEEIYRNVAPPGRSAHQQGRAVDFFPNSPEFARSAAYAWLARNAARFGFRESYPRERKYVSWEPWHFEFTPR